MLRLWPVVLGALLAFVGLLPAAVAADSRGELRDRASGLKQHNAELAARSRGVVLELYSLDARLARERARLVSLRIRAAEVRADLAQARERLGDARRSLNASQLALARRLQLLYEQGDSDPMAVVLGASSVADALSSLDSLDRIADQDRRVILQTRRARIRLEAVTRALTVRERELRRLADDAERSTVAIERSRSQRASYLADLSAQRRMNAGAISALQRQAQAVEARSQQLAAAAAARGAGTVTAAGRTLTVVATGYSLSGHTATGSPSAGASSPSIRA
jgi:peptidoglycan hydrolase CwlO-like protein